MADDIPDTAPAQEPCDSCSGSMRAMLELASALTFQRIQLPLAPDGRMNPEIRRYLADAGYHPAKARPVLYTNRLDGIENSDAISIASTDSEPESPAELSGWSIPQPAEPAPKESPATAGTSSPELLIAADPAEPISDIDERWYAITVGRDPGVFRGAHHVATNISGIPGGTAQRFTTPELAHAAYREALDAGNVVQVQFILTKTVLHHT